MARLKFNSVVLQKLKKRINGMKSIDSNLVLKNGISVQNSEKVADDLSNLQNEYNILLSLIDRKRNELLSAEKDGKELSKNIFIGVMNDYGDDSLEYESVGGIRRSLRQVKMVKADKKDLI